MTAYVLDASVAAKWVPPVKNEPLAGEAIRLLDGFGKGEINLSVPDLFWPEIGDILWKSVRLGRIGERSAHEATAWFQTLGIPTSPTGKLLGDAITIALVFDRTVYDSLV